MVSSMDYVTVSVKVKRELWEKLKKYNININEVIREALEKKVKEEKAKRLIREFNDFMEKFKPIKENLSAKIIREDRDDLLTK